MTAKSRTVNNISYIDATVTGKHVTISEASIRSDLLFDDADGMDSLNNQAIFDTIQLMSNQLKDVPVLLDHFPVSTLTKKVLKFMVKKEDEGEASERPSDSQYIPSPPHPKGSGRNHGGQSSNDASLLGNKDGLTLQSVYDLCVSLCKQVTAQAKEIKALKAQGVHKEYVSKQGRKSIKSFKGKPSMHKDPAVDDLDDFVDVDDTLDYMETEDDQNEGRTSSIVLKEKESADKEVSTEAPVSTDKQDKGTDKKNEGTDKQDGSTDNTKVSTDRQGEGTADQNEGKSATQTAPTPTSTPTTTIFDTERPRPTSKKSILTLKPLPKIDPKDKGKKRIDKEDESDTKSEGITEVEKKLKQLANDEEVARKIKRSDDSFIAIGSAEDKKVIKEMNEQAADASKKRVKKDDSVKEEIKEEEGTRKRKLGIRKKMKSKKRKFTSKDDEELRLYLTIVSDEDKESEEVEDVYLNVVIRSNRQRRYFSTLMATLSILDRDDICAIYQFVMNRYQDETPEGFDKILWGDLIIMFNQSGNDEFWNAQQNWKIVSWKLHSSSGVYTIMTDEGLVIHMLVENKYPLKKEVLSQLLELKLETEEDSTMALELIRLVKKHIAELEPKDSDGNEEDP
ncbi:hypothetical protein Tco_0583900 [Tanacetum coccineum]